MLLTLSVWTWTGARGEHAIAFLSARGEVLLLITSLRLKEPGKVAQPHTVTSDVNKGVDRLYCLRTYKRVGFGLNPGPRIR